MDKNKMTLHRALAELKLIDNKIEKSISGLESVGAKNQEKMVSTISSIDDFNKNAISKYDSIVDMISRKQRIKSAIVEANSKTKVVIGKVEMSISDAITYKTIIKQKELLLARLESQLRETSGQIMTENEKIDETALHNARIMLGKKEDENIKATDKDVDAIMTPFIKRMQLTLVDPLKIKKVIEELEVEIEEFNAEVDAILSEINAVTVIKI